MNGAEYIIKFLQKKGVDIVFGYPGGAVLTLYDALYNATEKGENIKHILTRHEQGAIHAAEGYAKATGKTGVVFATSGPGATNLVTGLADAMLDSVPILAITGQVVTPAIGHDAFQEADMLGVTLSITKHNYLIREGKNLPYILEEAWNIAKSGRYGPVLIDIAKNVFAEEINSDITENIVYTPKARKKIHSFELQKPKILEMLMHSFRPVIIAGGGVTSSENAPENMHKFIEKYNIPCAVTLMGKSVIDTSHPLALGMAGMHGLPAANTALAKSDLIIAVGTRFSDRTIGNPNAFSKGKSIIHADIDIAEISKNVKATLPVVTDANNFFMQMLEFDTSGILQNKTDEWRYWVQEVTAVKEKSEVSGKDTMRFGGKLKMREIIRYVSAKETGRGVSFVTDVGQHQMIAAQETHHKRPGTFISSGGLGTMGFGLPAAIGCSFGKSEDTGDDNKVILFAGDGSIQMNIQELATLKKAPVPVKIFILDNNRLGMVRQWQTHFYGNRHSQSVLNDNPDFCMIAAAYGIESVKIASREAFNEKIDSILASRETVLVHLLTDPEENVYPIIPAGKSNHEMILSEEA